MTLSGYEALFFWIFALAAIFAGLLTVMARNAVHSALFLISSLVSVAALFVLAGAEFIAGVQILVYVGGVMVLFLFVIMLVNVGAEERGKEEIFNNQRQVTASLIFCFLLVGGVLYAVSGSTLGLQSGHQQAETAVGGGQANAAQNSGAKNATGTSQITKDTERVGGSLYRYASLPFEIASILLLVAIIGSVMLARTLKQEASADDVDSDVLLEEIARDPELARDERRLLDHVALVEGGREPVVGHQVDQGAVAEPVAEPRLLEDVGSIRHRLHPTRDHDAVVPRTNHEIGDLDRTDARGADLVDRVRGRLDRQPGRHRGLPRGRLAGAALEHLSHDDVLNLVVRNACAVESRADGDRAEPGSLVVLEGAAQLAKRRADGGCDH